MYTKMFKLLPDKSEILSGALRLLQNANSNSRILEDNYTPEEVVKHLKENCKKAETADKSSTQKWMEYCGRSPHVRCVEAEVPPFILPNGYRGVLVDVKVQGKKWGPDDIVYDGNPEIRDRIARGNCVLKLTKDKMEHQPEFIFLMFGMKKFTGGWGDEDEDYPTRDVNLWQEYFTKPAASAKQIVCMRKVNGEAAHLSARQIGNKLMICAGSKNVHLLFASREDIDKYTDTRYAVAKTVANAVWKMLTEEMDTDDACLLLNLLVVTHMTANMEMLQPSYQHVENLEHLKAPQLNFLGWTRPYEEVTTTLIAIPPHFGLILAEAFGIKPAECQTIDSPRNMDELFRKILKTYNEEGRVLYFMDDNLNTIGLLKKKSAWYICLRALREKIVAAFARRRKGDSVHTVKTVVRKKINKRMEEIQKWLYLNNEYVNKWKELGEAFLVWSFDVPQAATDNKIRGQFPVLWTRFLQETERVDNIPFD